MKAMLKTLIQRVADVGTSDLRKSQERSERHLNAIRAMGHDSRALGLLPTLDVGYLPWSKFAIRPSALIVLLNEISLNHSRTVIECGVGISTLYMLCDSMPSDVRAIGIDDDLEWIATIRSYLEKMRVSSARYCLVYAPIKDYGETLSQGGKKWYDIDRISPCIENFLGDDLADMLVVDGPKGSLCERSRYPAMPWLRGYLRDDYSVFLDDIERKDEYETAQAWKREFNLDAEFYRQESGMAALRSVDTAKRRIVI